MTLFDKSRFSAARAVLLAIAIGGPPAALPDSASALTRPVQVANATYLKVIQSLKAQGYAIQRVSRTFLGRYQILARNRTQLREVIVSSSTGEIKRDAIIKRFEGDRADTGHSGAQHEGSAASGPSTKGERGGLSVGASLSATGGTDGSSSAVSSGGGGSGLGGL
ncbi:hypothetical protein BMG03_19515 (plasmid) [Thioclava nitratireducens]|uniref:PepSY domain-containing protein n=1 Tax=Thioclava nitratireducens TaxID=1915078 RepID=A0ABN4XII1_9RHOB|nr:hypothetical protein [Thioclava nitratireducens]AQS50104.1 hypothetical protein BMG03_19515 [Thioclava nitratireducens]